MISSEIVINRLNGETRRIREVHTDILGVEHEYNYEAPLDVTQITLDENLAIHASEFDEKNSEQEVQQWIADIESGLDPAHIGHDGDTWFTNSVPSFNTWEVAVDGAVTPFLQAEYMQEILKIATLWSRLTKAEGELIAGKNNAVSSEIAIATNTQAELDAYIPLIDENGDPRP